MSSVEVAIVMFGIESRSYTTRVEAQILMIDSRRRAKDEAGLRLRVSLRQMESRDHTQGFPVADAMKRLRLRVSLLK